MTSRNLTTAKATNDAWNAHDWKAAIGAYAERGAFTDHGRGITFKTREELRASWQELQEGVPDAIATDERFYDAGDTIVCTFIGRGTNTGPLLGMPPTGRRVSLPVCMVWHFDANGRIDREDQYYDSMSMMVQLGIAEAPGM